MANWLLIYSLGFATAVSAVALLALQRREAHGMSLRGVGQLAFSAGMVWPLLLIAGMQAAVLLALKALLGSVRGSASSGSAAKPVEAPALMSVATAAAGPAAVAA